jgi:hypothetical protein
MDFITNIFKNYSLYTFGWTSDSYNELFESNDAINILLTFILLFVILNLGHHIVFYFNNKDKVLKRIFIPLSLFYCIILNSVIHFLIIYVLFNISYYLLIFSLLIPLHIYSLIVLLPQYCELYNRYHIQNIYLVHLI